MAYKRYKKLVSKEEFYKNWTKEKLDSLLGKLKDSVELKDSIYKDHISKCKMLQRDNFTCQNREKVKTEDGKILLKPCKFCKNVPEYPHLTRHHIKAKRNKGKSTVRNQITICKGSHNHHNKGGDLVFPPDEHLPPHVRKQTFRLHKPDKLDMKKKKKEGRELRQEMKRKLPETIKKILKTIPPGPERQWYKLRWDEVLILIRWLTIPYDEFEDEELD